MPYPPFGKVSSGLRVHQSEGLFGNGSGEDVRWLVGCCSAVGHEVMQVGS